MFEKELLEDTQYALGLLNAESGGQLNSNNSITGAIFLNGVKRTNSNEDILQYSKIIDENGEPMVFYMKLFSECIKCSLQNFVPYQAVTEVSGSSGHKSSS